MSLSTTGYGDITPSPRRPRLINVLVITPLRVAFLIVLVGTTVETLTEQSRQALKIQRWRNKVRNHTIVVGYGTKGRTAVAAMISDDVQPADIVVVDENPAALERAESAGLVTVHGNATDSDVLRLAGAQHAESIIVATNRDDTAVLVTLTARELAPERQDRRRDPRGGEPAPAAAVRRRHHGRRPRRPPAGCSASPPQTPSVVEMIEDLLTPDAGFAIAERDVERRTSAGHRGT